MGPSSNIFVQPQVTFPNQIPTFHFRANLFFRISHHVQIFQNILSNVYQSFTNLYQSFCLLISFNLHQSLNNLKKNVGILVNLCPICNIFFLKSQISFIAWFLVPLEGNFLWVLINHCFFGVFIFFDNFFTECNRT